MGDAAVDETVAAVIRQAEELESSGRVRDAIDLLSMANRRARHADVEGALVRIRRAGGITLTEAASPAYRERIAAGPPADGVFEVEAADLTTSALRAGLAQSGCVLVRGLVAPDRVARLVAGIDAAIASFDALANGNPSFDRGWYSPGSMQDRVAEGLPEEVNRKFLRDRGGVWTADSPRMLFELLEVVDDSGIGILMSEFLGERPVLSANKCTLRRVPPELVVKGGWHQDGAFLGDHVGSFNFWLSLSPCGLDAPGLDILPRRVDHVVPSDEGSRFDWSLSDEAVLRVADGIPIVRPRFEAGDALLFDHLLVHQTATSPAMTRERHAIESWFFAPSAYPVGQIPILY